MPIRYTALVVISATGWIKADLIKGNVRDNDIRTFCLETQEPSPDTPNLGGPPLRTLMKPKSYLIWDRLGRAGRCRNPTKLHYNLDVERDLSEKEISIRMLPPKGHILNPIELFNSALQDRVSKYSATPAIRDEYGRKELGPQNFHQCRVALSEALEFFKDKPTTFKGFYNKRAFGAELEERMSGSREAKKAMQERTEVIINAQFKDFEE